MDAVREIHPLLPRVRDIEYHQRKVWILCDDQIAIYDREAGSWILMNSGQLLLGQEFSHSSSTPPWSFEDVKCRHIQDTNSLSVDKE